MWGLQQKSLGTTDLDYVDDQDYQDDQDFLPCLSFGDFQESLSEMIKTAYTNILHVVNIEIASVKSCSSAVCICSSHDSSTLMS